MTTVNARSTQFNSSNLQAATLHPDGRLEVTFRADGKRAATSYSYANFTEAQFEEFVAAKSAGSWFDKNVKKRADAHPLVPTPPPKPGELVPPADATAWSAEQRPVDTRHVSANADGTFSIGGAWPAANAVQEHPPVDVAALAAAATLNAEELARKLEAGAVTMPTGGASFDGKVTMDRAALGTDRSVETLVEQKEDGTIRVLDTRELPPVVVSNQPETVLVDARRYYEAYCRNSGWLNFQGKLCPQWPELPSAIRGNWCAVVLEARQLEQHPAGDYATGSPLDQVYDERNRLAAAFARSVRKLGWKVGIGEHDPNDTAWDPKWRTILYIDTPNGQLSWHLHDRDRALLVGLPRYAAAWDGHSTQEKYERLERLP